MMQKYGDAVRQEARRKQPDRVLSFVPWFIFLFVGVYDFGFYGYSLIATTASARAAAGYCAQSSSTETACNASTTTACTYALDTLKFLPNVSVNVTSCGAAPVTLSESSGTDAYSNPYVVVTVAYTSPKVIPIRICLDKSR